jgi:hypothetical protein
MTEMTRRHNKIISVVRRAIEENIAERLVLKIDDTIVIRKEDLSEEVRILRPDVNCVTRACRSSHMVRIDMSCPDGCISYGANTLEKLYIEKKQKYNRLAQETRNVQETQMEIIPLIVSSRGSMSGRSLETFRNLLLCNDKKMKKIGRRRSEVPIMGSTDI